MVNSDQIDPTTIHGWADLWRPEFANDILVVDGARETLGMALQTLDLSQNELDTANLQQAIERLEALRPNVKAVLTDEIKTLMVNNDAPIGIGYSGDAAYVMSENPAITYVVP